MENRKVTIIIVTWNSKNYISEALESIKRQKNVDYSIIIIDNNSYDGTIEFIKNYHPEICLFQNFKNIGYSKANNQGIKMSNSEYVLVMNPDIILGDNFLFSIIQFADKHQKGGSFCGKYFKICNNNPELHEKNLLSQNKNIIDSAGLIILKNRKAINYGEGEIDNEKYNMIRMIFGAPGCLALYRRKALQDAMIFNEFFDEDFFAYKEDVDLAWRLRMLGWESWYTPDAIAFHYRKLSAPMNNKIKSIIISKKSVSKKLQMLSFRNQHLMVVKNDTGVNFLLHIFHITYWELKLLLYMLFYAPFLWKSFFEFLSLIPKTLKKRRVIMLHRMVSSKDMRNWFT